MSKQRKNNLVKETSPYLLQHADNPVEWYAWNEDALNKAVEEDKRKAAEREVQLKAEEEAKQKAAGNEGESVPEPEEGVK